MELITRITRKLLKYVPVTELPEIAHLAHRRMRDRLSENLAVDLECKSCRSHLSSTFNHTIVRSRHGDTPSRGVKFVCGCCNHTTLFEMVNDTEVMRIPSDQFDALLKREARMYGARSTKNTQFRNSLSNLRSNRVRLRLHQKKMEFKC